jgi:hypothetical protein
LYHARDDEDERLETVVRRQMEDVPAARRAVMLPQHIPGGASVGGGASVDGASVKTRAGRTVRTRMSADDAMTDI